MFDTDALRCQRSLRIQNMPWTADKPYIAQLFAHESEEPTEVFYETPDQLEAEIEEHKKSGLYSRIWSGLGKSENRNEWEEIGEWERGN
jgi:hypothetical protein